MKIGDRVRFLNEVGGGIIAGFPSKKTVLVTDESGFDIPVLVTDVVVVETDGYNIVRTPKEEAKAKKQSETKQPVTVTTMRRRKRTTDLSPFARAPWNAEELMFLISS